MHFFYVFYSGLEKNKKDLLQVERENTHTQGPTLSRGSLYRTRSTCGLYLKDWLHRTCRIILILVIIVVLVLVVVIAVDVVATDVVVVDLVHLKPGRRWTDG